MSFKSLDRALIATSIVGVLVSTYALHVEMAVEAHPGYTAMCDIGEYASCSKVLTSKYSKGFGLLPDNSSMKIPNCIYGIIFYCLMIFLYTGGYYDNSLFNGYSQLVNCQIGVTVGFAIFFSWLTMYGTSAKIHSGLYSGCGFYLWWHILGGLYRSLGFGVYTRATFDQRLIVRLQVLCAVSSVASSVYLAYLLAFVLHDFCIVCVSTYFVNGFLVYFTWKKGNSLALKNK